MVDEKVLERLPLFGELSAAAKRELAARSVLRSFAPDEVLWQAGTEPRGLFVLLEGQVRVVRTVGGRQHVIHTEGPGGTLGDVPLFAGGPYPATAVATRRTQCLVLDRTAIAAAIQADPSLAFSLLARLAQRVRLLIDRVDRLAGQSVGGRLAGYLLERHRQASSPSLTLGCTQAALAEELGTVREVLVRALRELREAGIIRTGPHGSFEVLDPERLRRLAEDGRA